MTKEILILTIVMIITMIIMSMQNKLYTVQPSHHLTASPQEVTAKHQTPGKQEELIASCPPANPHS